MDQAIQQSSTVSSAAEALEQSGLLDSFEDREERQSQAPIDEIETDEDESDEEVTDEEVGESDTDESDEDETEAESESEESDEEEQQEIESLSDLAAALEVSQDDLLDKLKVEVVIDGESRPVTLREAQAGYQKDADYRRKTGELASQRREFEAKAQQSSQEVEYQHQVAASMLLEAERQLMGDLNSHTMSQLQSEDPAAWAAKYAAMNQRQQQLQALKQQAAQAYMQHQQKSQSETSEARQLRLAQEMEALQKLVPDFKTVKPKIESYLSEAYGYTNEDMGSVADHRIIDLARKAMLYDAQNQTVDAVKKKVKLKPKMQKPTKKAATPNKAAENLRVSKSRLKKSGHIRDAASAIESLL